MSKREVTIIIIILCFAIKSFSQFGADYSSYGFNFIHDQYNIGLKNWSGINISDTNKINVYKQDSQNNYALELKPVAETLRINYSDSGYMDLNPCSFKIILRIKINQYSGNNDTLNFTLLTGRKKVSLIFTENGIFYTKSTNNIQLITTEAPLNIWKTYSISLDNCATNGVLMIENDTLNTFPLDFPADSSVQSISICSSTDGNSTFSSEIDHLFIYSNPIKWWLGPSTPFIDDTPSGYTGTTGDRQHFLSLSNGERIGVNENGGGYITFTELYPGGPNLDPFPKFGSGGTKTLRGYFHTNKFNPVQAGISSTSGGHLVNVISSSHKIEVESFPLHSFLQDDFTENTPLIFPSNDTLHDGNAPAIVDDDVYDEFGLDMRHELMSELDFRTSIENVSRPNEISSVRHTGEWEYIRHPSHILQFHEVVNKRRPQFETSSGANNDMGDMRHKFEFRLNRDLGYEWVFWRDTNSTWQSVHLDSIGSKKTIEINTSTKLEQRFLVFSTSSNPNDPGAMGWFYPESNYNKNGTLGKSRNDKTIMYTHDRRTSVSIVADWRKTNWCRMNLYVRNEGLLAPCNGNPNIYEAFQMEALQLFGTVNEILSEVLNNHQASGMEVVLSDKPAIYPNPFTSEITIKWKNLQEKEVRLYTISGSDISNSIEFISLTNNVVKLRLRNLNTGLYILKIGTTSKKVYKQ